MKQLNCNLINSIHEDDDFIWIGTAGGGFKTDIIKSLEV